MRNIDFAHALLGSLSNHFERLESDHSKMRLNCQSILSMFISCTHIPLLPGQYSYLFSYLFTRTKNKQQMHEKTTIS